MKRKSPSAPLVTRTCSSCGDLREVLEGVGRPAEKSGLCHKCRNREWYRKNKAKPPKTLSCSVCGVTWESRTATNSSGMCRRCYAVTSTREHRKIDPDYNRRSVLKCRYGLTIKEYEDLLHAQGGVCAICKTSDPGDGKKKCFHVDHDHKTGAVRGLLCISCNMALGSFDDDPARLRVAAAYLEKARVKKWLTRLKTRSTKPRIMSPFCSSVARTSATSS